MRIIFSDKTKEDFRKHRNYLKRVGKSDGHKYQRYELDGISKSLKKNITKGLENRTNHTDSIFPDKYEYDHKNYKMYVDKDSHHIIFYKVNPNKDTIKVEKCIHSTELKKDIERRGIKPIGTASKSLLDDLEEVYKEDEVYLRDDSKDDEDGKEENVYDEETGKEIKRNVFTGPRGGRFYRTDKGEKVYIDEKKSFKSLKKVLMEEKIIPLKGYIKKRSAVTPLFKESKSMVEEIKFTHHPPERIRI